MNLDAQAGEKGLVVPDLLYPIDSASFDSDPIVAPRKRGVESLSNASRAVRLGGFLQNDFCLEDDLLEFEKKISQPEPANLVPSAAVVGDFGDLHIPETKTPG